MLWLASAGACLPQVRSQQGGSGTLSLLAGALCACCRVHLQSASARRVTALRKQPANLTRHQQGVAGTALITAPSLAHSSREPHFTVLHLILRLTWTYDLQVHETSPTSTFACTSATRQAWQQRQRGRHGAGDANACNRTSSHAGALGLTVESLPWTGYQRGPHPI
jgi:hypothetical protein